MRMSGHVHKSCLGHRNPARFQDLRLTADFFEEEKFLGAITEALAEGGVIEVSLDSRDYTTEFNCGMDKK